MWNPRKKTSSRPEYSYEPKGSSWRVIRWEITGNFGSGTQVATFPTREEARKECYRLNGWKYTGPRSNSNNT